MVSGEHHIHWSFHIVCCVLGHRVDHCLWLLLWCIYVLLCFCVRTYNLECRHQYNPHMSLFTVSIYRSYAAYITFVLSILYCWHKFCRIATAQCEENRRKSMYWNLNKHTVLNAAIIVMMSINRLIGSMIYYIDDWEQLYLHWYVRWWCASLG